MSFEIPSEEDFNWAQRDNDSYRNACNKSLLGGLEYRSLPVTYGGVLPKPVMDGQVLRFPLYHPGGSRQKSFVPHIALSHNHRLVWVRL